MIKPKSIELSLIDSCNRKCSFCPKSNETVAPNTSLEMPDFLYEKLADELKCEGYDGQIMLAGYGEPLMYKNILSVVRAFAFTDVDIVTNGDFLTDGLLRDLKRFGVHKITVSVYDKDRLDYFNSLGVTVRDCTNGVTKLTNRAGTLYKKHLDNYCYYPFYMLMVDCNGDVYPCCQEWQRKLKVGNLYQSTIWEIWESEDLNKIRRIHKEGVRDLYPCNICDVDGTLKGKEYFERFSS